MSLSDRIGPACMGGSLGGSTSQDKKIHLTDTEGENETIFDDSRGEVISLAFSRDAKYLVGGDVSSDEEARGGDPGVDLFVRTSLELWTYGPHRCGGEKGEGLYHELA